MNNQQIGLYQGECWIETYTGKFVNPLALKQEDMERRLRTLTAKGKGIGG